MVSSGGTFPVSVTAHGNLVYVANARDSGSIQGFARVGHHLRIISRWNRQLGLSGTPEFTHTPGQVAFTPNGSKLLVTTKDGSSSIDVFTLGIFGRPSAQPVVNFEAGAVPFAVSFDGAGRVAVAEAGTNAVDTFRLGSGGVLKLIDHEETGQAATCWIVRNGRNLYASNAGSATVSGYQDNGAGVLTSLGTTATDAGTVDAAASSDGQFVYVQAAAAGQVDEFAANADGSLTAIGSVTVPDGVGGEGIVAL